VFPSAKTGRRSTPTCHRTCLSGSRTGKRLSYEIIELSEPRVIKGPSLAPVRCNGEAVTLSG